MIDLERAVCQRLCKTCHWWFGDDGERRPCVFHIGMRGEKAARIEYGGNKTLKTSADFGCTDWTKDERKKDEPHE
jgi:hypothetical protein